LIVREEPRVEVAVREDAGVAGGRAVLPPREDAAVAEDQAVDEAVEAVERLRGHDQIDSDVLMV
jgi:hypothetical protein